MKTSKRYKCPYCEYRHYRDKLITHVEQDHEEMIPKDYTPSRVVYNSINKREHGSCMICHKETEWDESKQRYNSLCSNPKCKTKYVEIVRSRMVKKYGKPNLLDDPEFQKKMLENRSISGKYKFQDGGSIGYVGSYEKKFLEFMDVFLHIKSYDIISPGPTIPYMYKGKEHVWITDFLYEPYNLVFDIKDGGDNPNTRDMKEYREKQIAKENAIAEYGDYNYIRLTNNNFEQLISIFMELKEKEEHTKPLIRINESYIEEGLFDFFKSQNYQDMNSVIRSLSREEKKYLDNTLSSSEHLLYLDTIKEDGKTVAFISCADAGLGDNSVSVSIAVNPNYRGKGYAKKLVRDLISNSKNHNIEVLFWRVYSDNTSSIKLAESMGFRKVRDGGKQVVYSYLINKNRKYVLIPGVNNEDDLKKYVYKNIKNISPKLNDKVNSAEITLRNKKGSYFDQAKLVQECLLTMGLPSYTFIIMLYTIVDHKPIVLNIYPVCFTTYDDSSFILLDTYFEDLEGQNIVIRQPLEQVLQSIYDIYTPISYKLLDKIPNTGAYSMYTTILKIKDNTKLIDLIDIEKLRNSMTESAIQESKNKSKLDKNFKKKSGIKFIIYDIHDPKALKFIKKDAKWGKDVDYIKNNCNGEIAVDTNTQKIIGRILIKEKDIGTGITGFYVDKDYRGYGIGETLFNDAVNKYNGEILGVYSDNEVAIHMYKKYGFETIETQMDEDGEYYIMKRNNLLESYVEEECIQEMIETRLVHPFLPRKVNLYHGSPTNDIEVINPNSYNMGTKFSHPRSSSFWFIEIDYAKGFAVLEIIGANLSQKAKLYIDKDMKAAVPEKYKDEAINILKNHKIYVYEKQNMDSKYLGVGHGKGFPEYTLDFPVRPDNVYTFEYPDTLRFVNFRSDEYFEDLKKYYHRKYHSLVYYNYEDFKAKGKEIRGYAKESYMEEESINENYLISKDDIYLNFDLWKKNTPHNILYITGISGSGKSTISRELCKKYNAEYIELDMFTNLLVKGKDTWLAGIDSGKYNPHELIVKYHELNSDLPIISSWEVNGTMSYEHDKLLEWIINQVRNTNKLYIVDGAQLFMTESEKCVKMIQGEPLIVKGTSALVSHIRRVKRDLSNKSDIKGYLHTIKKDIPLLFKYYFKNEKLLQDFIKSVNESYIQESKNNNCLIISAFAGTGKDYAMNYFRNKGFKVNSIEKLDKISRQFGSDANYIRLIKSLSKGSDILFIPYFLDMEKNILKGQVDYYMVYPSKNLKSEYIKRFKQIGFTDPQIKNFEDNWDDMIEDCKRCKNPIELKGNEYLSDVVEQLLSIDESYKFDDIELI